VRRSLGEASGGNIGLGFAVPVNVAKTISSEIIATGRATHAYFGLQTVPIPAESAAQAGVPRDCSSPGSWRAPRPPRRDCAKAT
jgi:S1-C subfamily serine protease